MVRAKFRLDSVTHYQHNRVFDFEAVGDEKTPENQRFTKYTPGGHIKITVTNPEVKFEIGKFYYVDFTEAAS